MSTRGRTKLGVVALLFALVPLQWTVVRGLDQEPFPAFFLPGFGTGSAPVDDTIRPPVSKATVEYASGRSVRVSAADIFGEFPAAPRILLVNWFWLGLDEDGGAGPCVSSRYQALHPGLLQSACPGRSRDGREVLTDERTVIYLRERFAGEGGDMPVKLTVEWRREEHRLGTAETRRDAEVVRQVVVNLSAVSA